MDLIMEKYSSMKRIDILEEGTKVQERIDALEFVIEEKQWRTNTTLPVHKNDEVLTKMLHEYKQRRAYLKGAKEYMVHFEGGGWNTCYGQDEECALINARIEHETNEDVKGIDQNQYAHKELKVRSVSLASTEGIEAAMRLFH